MSTPTTVSVLRLATWPSPMALEQTDRFADLVRRWYPDITLETIHVVSEGDAHRGPLTQIGGKGAFTRRADTLLLDGRVDATIACAKDVPSEHDRSPGISLGAVLPREDARDALVLPTGHPPTRLADLPPATRVGTSAPRRAALLRALHPHLVPVPIRGNADRRLTRLDAGTLGADVMIAAYAGLRRLGHTDRASEILDPSLWLPASGAGIVTIGHRTGDTATHSLLAALTHMPTDFQYTAERAALAALKGGVSPQSPSTPYSTRTAGNSPCTPPSSTRSATLPSPPSRPAPAPKPVTPDTAPVSNCWPTVLPGSSRPATTPESTAAAEHRADKAAFAPPEQLDDQNRAADRPVQKGRARAVTGQAQALPIWKPAPAPLPSPQPRPLPRAGLHPDSGTAPLDGLPRPGPFRQARKHTNAMHHERNRQEQE
ncbi:hydroxymethylbilane synthase [Streptomyces atratus]|uniref:hydroxymethylbilane synthase n=1 Tax=Streptomyces atratus TaxID=1893 RepID=UPI00225401F4|nr:hydroxymethylbilane synthase [Streptomyces atratus]MCX5338567.1 hydroxymethylbilane synthase [Streptomyces atratus]